MITSCESKILRANRHTPTIEAGKIFLLSGSSWIKPFIEEVNLFPYGKHDDQVDALMQLIDAVEKRQHDWSIIDIAAAIERDKQKSPQGPLWDAAFRYFKTNLWPRKPLF